MEQLQSIISAIVNNIPIALTIIGTFATIATLTPNKNDDKIVQFLLDLVNFLACNLGKSKNRDE